jgi:hypothetical protein
MTEQRPNPALHLVGPLLAFGATFVVRKALTSGYRRFTGKSAPNPQERGTPLMTVLVWTAATSAATALVEVLVYRLTAPEPANESAPEPTMGSAQR